MYFIIFLCLCVDVGATTVNMEIYVRNIDLLDEQNQVFLNMILHYIVYL